MTRIKEKTNEEMLIFVHRSFTIIQNTIRVLQEEGSSRKTYNASQFSLKFLKLFLHGKAFPQLEY